MASENLHSPAPVATQDALLLLADGTVFYGRGIGNPGTVTGEICFNTAMTGYQEVLTDPSYHGQIITFTFPHIGNVGANPEDIESVNHGANGLIVRELVTPPSNYRSTIDFNLWLKEKEITGISGIDTRALTRHIRLHGAQNCLIAYIEGGTAQNLDALKEKLGKVPNLDGLELAKNVTTKSSYGWSETRWKHGVGYGKSEKGKFKVVAIDYGEKLNILRSLTERGCQVTAVGSETSAEDIIAMKPDGIFLSNGPGDPAATGKYAVNTIRSLINAGLPIFGICLGHQLVSLAMGAKTEKMHQGHRGANHPVKNLKSGAVEITSQNHGFVVTEGSLPKDVEITHISLFDGTIEGVRHKTKPVFSVQYHPESSPGPHDSQYLFDDFLKLMEENKSSESRVRSSVG